MASSTPAVELRRSGRTANPPRYFTYNENFTPVQAQVNTVRSLAETAPRHAQPLPPLQSGIADGADISLSQDIDEVAVDSQISEAASLDSTPRQSQNTAPTQSGIEGGVEDVSGMESGAGEGDVADHAEIEAAPATSTSGHLTQAIAHARSVVTALGPVSAPSPQATFTAATVGAVTSSGEDSGSAAHIPFVPMTGARDFSLTNLQAWVLNLSSRGYVFVPSMLDRAEALANPAFPVNDGSSTVESSGPMPEPVKSTNVSANTEAPSAPANVSASSEVPSVTTNVPNSAEVPSATKATAVLVFAVIKRSECEQFELPLMIPLYATAKEVLDAVMSTRTPAAGILENWLDNEGWLGTSCVPVHIASGSLEFMSARTRFFELGSLSQIRAGNVAPKLSPAGRSYPETRRISDVHDGLPVYALYLSTLPFQELASMLNTGKHDGLAVKSESVQHDTPLIGPSSSQPTSRAPVNPSTTLVRPKVPGAKWAIPLSPATMYLHRTFVTQFEALEEACKGFESTYSHYQIEQTAHAIAKAICMEWPVTGAAPPAKPPGAGVTITFADMAAAFGRVEGSFRNMRGYINDFRGALAALRVQPRLDVYNAATRGMLECLLADDPWVERLEPPYQITTLDRHNLKQTAEHAMRTRVRGLVPRRRNVTTGAVAGGA